jgi:4-hydroxy-tetrahydrodipicolinate synthase
MSKYAESVGADAVLLVTPYYNKTTQKGLVAHYKAISSEIKIPIILYNVPSRTNMNITPTTLLRLTQLNNVVAIKEASGDLSQIAKMKMKRKQLNKRLKTLSHYLKNSAQH